MRARRCLRGGLVCPLAATRSRSAAGWGGRKGKGKRSRRGSFVFWARLFASATGCGPESARNLRRCSGAERQRVEPRDVSEVYHELECWIVRRCARRRRPRPTSLGQR